MLDLALFFLAAAVSCGFCVPTRNLLIHAGIIDHPNERSSHVTPTVRGGGLPIIFTVLAGLIWLFSVHAESPLVALGCGVLLLAVVSWFDDRKSLPNRVRIAAHVFAALLVLYGLHWPTLRLALQPAAGILLPTLAGLVLLTLWITGYTNAFNFMDGINGLAAGQAAVTGVGTALIAGLATGTWTSSPILLSAIVAGAAAGFLPHNFPRARMFMGDVGSAPLGFLLASLALWIAVRAGWWLLAPLCLLHANFVLDTVITLGRRVLNGEKWYAAHREHFYQRLVRAGKAHTFVTRWEMALEIIVLGMMVGYVFAPLVYRVVLICGAMGLWFVFFAYCEWEFRGAATRVKTPTPVKSATQNAG
jgi:UDP-N-acetylmuramyl pentapeptide phosphotransferase/UDP-N-acetylglucosamine-1-phosphate transferase